MQLGYSMSNRSYSVSTKQLWFSPLSACEVANYELAWKALKPSTDKPLNNFTHALIHRFFNGNLQMIWNTLSSCLIDLILIMLRVYRGI